MKPVLQSSGQSAICLNFRKDPNFNPNQQYLMGCQVSYIAFFTLKMSNFMRNLSTICGYN